MAADFTPIGGGCIGKAEAFAVLANALGIEERPIADVRLEVFRLVHDLGSHFMESSSKRDISMSPSMPESWDMLGMLYEGLAELESEAMRPTYASNREQFLTQRAAEAEQEDGHRPL